MTSSLHDAIRRHSRCDAQHLLLMLFNPFLEGAVRKNDGLERFPSERTSRVGRLQHCLDSVALVRVTVARDHRLCVHMALAWKQCVASTVMGASFVPRIIVCIGVRASSEGPQVGRALGHIPRSLSKVMGHRNSSGRGSVPRPYDSRCACRSTSPLSSDNLSLARSISAGGSENAHACAIATSSVLTSAPETADVSDAAADSMSFLCKCWNAKAWELPPIASSNARLQGM